MNTFAQASKRFDCPARVWQWSQRAYLFAKGLDPYVSAVSTLTEAHGSTMSLWLGGLKQLQHVSICFPCLKARKVSSLCAAEKIPAFRPI